MVGPNFRVGKKIGCGNFGELRLGKYCCCLFLFSRMFIHVWRESAQILSAIYISVESNVYLADIIARSS